MRSTRNFWASVVFLLAVPGAVAALALFGIEAEAVLHFEMAVGLLLLDPVGSETRFGVKVIGIVATVLLGMTFAFQGLAQIVESETLRWVAFQFLGQWLESLFVDLLLIWFVGVLLAASVGKLKILGFVCVGLAVGVKLLSYALPVFGTSLDEQYPALKMLLLMPFVWLMLESKKRR